MKSSSILAAFSICLTSLVFTGCMTSPVTGVIYSDVSGPVAATSNPRGPNHGEACATSYFGLIALGDATITKAVKNGGISSISYVEQKTNNILGVNTYCTEVWGFPSKTMTSDANPGTSSTK